MSLLSWLPQGTTEKIFEEKKDLYDVYVDNQNVKTHRSHLQPLLRLNAADKEKYRKLSEQRYAMHPLIFFLILHHSQTRLAQ